ncbi:TPO5 [[Candida] subhashii]|uniref:TPO5 n=1 Tax=[Candida] subhashii TaxID=561895 RepID=A0A8J5UWS7_9ASCO|nr:TPO5 [[Candida] subhashii]KAG7661864.1 TPO5 [[Candida] subhashii]
MTIRDTQSDHSTVVFPQPPPSVFQSTPSHLSGITATSPSSPSPATIQPPNGFPIHPEAPPPSYTSHNFNFSDIGSSAPIRYIGSLIQEGDDDEQIEQVEHFKYTQDLERKLTVTSVIGLGFSVMGVPFGLSSTLWISLMDGANVTILYGWLLVGILSLCVVLSLCEIISKYPTAGGVYHFSAILSNEKYSKVSSWYTGWFLLIGNWTYAISIMFGGAQFILSIFGLKDVYVYKEDKILVLIVFFAILLFAGFVNFVFSKHLEKINKMCILWTIYTVLAIDFLLIFFAKRTNSIKEILTTFDNTRSGWPDPLAFIIGLQSPSFTITGYGMLFSITDEVKNPERNMPKGAISAIVMATITGIIFIIPILTILPELKLLLDDTPNIMPIDLVFKLATESYIVSFLMALLMIGTVLFQSIGSLTTASRSTYALARDGGLPKSHLFTEVNSIKQYTIPRNALLLSMAVCGTLSFLSLISQTAFNAFMGAAVISLALANGIPIFCLMLNKRRKLRGAPFKLYKIGWVINGISVIWVISSIFILCMPPVIKHLSWKSMNFSVVVFVLFIGIASLQYVTWGRNSFVGPQLDTDYFELNNLESAARKNLDQFVVGDEEEDELEEKGDIGEVIKGGSIGGGSIQVSRRNEYIPLEGNSNRIDSDRESVVDVHQRIRGSLHIKRELTEDDESSGLSTRSSSNDEDDNNNDDYEHVI